MAASDPALPPAGPSTSNLADLARHAYAKRILGDDDFKRIADSRILVVGAGGIGCELLKNLVLVGFGNIEIIDLDTIDLSNLNRQFLFNKSHIKKPKSLIASQTASAFNPHVSITPHHANIKEARYGIDYFSSFDLVLNALDNLDARRWVNRMCIAADVPLVESGTTGFLGQVQPIKRGITQCYDCTPKPVPKTFPVCTIRSTPSTPIHCIVWAKSWLFTQLFGADDETEDAELDKALADGEDATEIANLRAEAREMRDIRASLLEADASKESAKRVFEKVFKRDVERLLSMEEMWRNRRKPVPLDFDAAKIGDGEKGETSSNGAAGNLQDQRQLSLKETVELFEKSLNALSQRARADPSTPLSFDKDDDDALDFVTASSNLRSRVYAIDARTRFQVKEMAGNIIPAIASTNAVIAGALVLQAIQVLRAAWEDMRYTKLGSLTMEKRDKVGTSRLIAGWQPEKPNPQCPVCADVYVPVQADVGKAKLGALIEAVKRERTEGGVGLGEETGLEIFEGSRLLGDEDFDDNVGKTLGELGVKVGDMVTVVDEDAELQTVQLVITPLAEESEAGFKLPDQERMPSVGERFKPHPAAKDGEASDGDNDGDFEVLTEAPAALKDAAPRSKKRRAEGEPDEASKKSRTEEGETATKKARVERNGASEAGAIELV